MSKDDTVLLHVVIRLQARVRGKQAVRRFRLLLHVHRRLRQAKLSLQRQFLSRSARNSVSGLQSISTPLTVERPVERVEFGHELGHDSRRSLSVTSKTILNLEASRSLPRKTAPSISGLRDDTRLGFLAPAQPNPLSADPSMMSEEGGSNIVATLAPLLEQAREVDLGRYDLQLYLELSLLHEQHKRVISVNALLVNGIQTNCMDTLQVAQARAWRIDEEIAVGQRWGSYWPVEFRLPRVSSALRARAAARHSLIKDILAEVAAATASRDDRLLFKGLSRARSLGVDDQIPLESVLIAKRLETERRLSDRLVKATQRREAQVLEDVLLECEALGLNQESVPSLVDARAALYVLVETDRAATRAMIKEHGHGRNRYTGHTGGTHPLYVRASKREHYCNRPAVIAIQDAVRAKDLVLLEESLNHVEREDPTLETETIAETLSCTLPPPMKHGFDTWFDSAAPEEEHVDGGGGHAFLSDQPIEVPSLGRWFCANFPATTSRTVQVHGSELVRVARMLASKLKQEARLTKALQEGIESNSLDSLEVAVAEAEHERLTSKTLEHALEMRDCRRQVLHQLEECMDTTMQDKVLEAEEVATLSETLRGVLQDAYSIGLAHSSIEEVRAGALAYDGMRCAMRLQRCLRHVQHTHDLDMIGDSLAKYATAATSLPLLALATLASAHKEAEDAFADCLHAHTTLTQQEAVGDALRRARTSKAQTREGQAHVWWTEARFQLAHFPALRSLHNFSRGFLFGAKKALEASMLRHSTRPLPRPLMYLGSRARGSLALKNFKRVQGFMEAGQDSPKKDALGLQVVKLGCVNPALRDEIVLQLMKQLQGTPLHAAHMRGWHLLCLCCAAFPVSSKLFPFVLHFLHRFQLGHLHGASFESQEVSPYAVCAQENVLRHARMQDWLRQKHVEERYQAQAIANPGNASGSSGNPHSQHGGNNTRHSFLDLGHPGTPPRIESRVSGQHVRSSSGSGGGAGALGVYGVFGSGHGVGSVHDHPLLTVSEASYKEAMGGSTAGGPQRGPFTRQSLGVPESRASLSHSRKSISMSATSRGSRGSTMSSASYGGLSHSPSMATLAESDKDHVGWKAVPLPPPGLDTISGFRQRKMRPAGVPLWFPDGSVLNVWALPWENVGTTLRQAIRWAGMRWDDQLEKKFGIFRQYNDGRIIGLDPHSFILDNIPRASTRAAQDSARQKRAETKNPHPAKGSHPNSTDATESDWRLVVLLRLWHDPATTESEHALVRTVQYHQTLFNICNQALRLPTCRVATVLALDAFIDKAQYFVRISKLTTPEEASEARQAEVTPRTLTAEKREQLLKQVQQQTVKLASEARHRRRQKKHDETLKDSKRRREQQRARDSDSASSGSDRGGWSEDFGPWTGGSGGGGMHEFDSKGKDAYETLLDPAELVGKVFAEARQSAFFGCQVFHCHKLVRYGSKFQSKKAPKSVYVGVGREGFVLVGENSTFIGTFEYASLRRLQVSKTDLVIAIQLDAATTNLHRLSTTQGAELCRLAADYHPDIECSGMSDSPTEDA